jgi:hypothetical protein
MVRCAAFRAISLKTQHINSFNAHALFCNHFNGLTKRFWGQDLALSGVLSYFVVSIIVTALAGLKKIVKKQ